MTTATVRAPLVELVRRQSDRPLTWPRALWLGGTLLLLTMIVHVVALGIRGGAVNGPVSLRKPATFAESGWLMCWSVALILPALATQRWQRIVIGTSTLLFGIGETTVMGIQAWRAVPSHYNFSTPVDAALVRVGAAGFAGALIVGMAVLLVAAIRTPHLSTAARLGISAGVAVLLIGCMVGLIMISNNSGVFQGSVGSGFSDRRAAYLGPSSATVGPQYVLLRPDTQGGDLVLPHAIAIHALVLVSVPALLLTRAGLGRARQVQVVLAAVSAMALGLALLLVHAFRQLPLDELAPTTLAGLALCAVVVGSVFGYSLVAYAGVRGRNSAASA